MCLRLETTWWLYDLDGVQICNDDLAEIEILVEELRRNEPTSKLGAGHYFVIYLGHDVTVMSEFPTTTSPSQRREALLQKFYAPSRYLPYYTKLWATRLGKMETIVARYQQS
jgi:hypothetical protein